MDRTPPVIADIAERHTTKTIFNRFISPVKPGDMQGQRRGYSSVIGISRASGTRAFSTSCTLDRLVPAALVVDKPIYSLSTAGGCRRCYGSCSRRAGD
jgi:hypothetical protein